MLPETRGEKPNNQPQDFDEKETKKKVSWKIGCNDYYEL